MSIQIDCVRLENNGLWPSGADRHIVTGPHAGKPCFYKTALYSTLVALKPRLCLEIGTHYGGTTAVFQKYFQEHRPDGLLVTADIKQFVTIDDPRVVQVVVHPHSADVVERHWITAEEMHNIDFSNSVRYNAALLQGAVYWDKFDFAFIDGDHQADSALKDIEICKKLLMLPCYMLLDDTKEGLHEVSKLYQEKLVYEYEHYDFEDWELFVSAGLIWERDTK